MLDIIKEFFGWTNNRPPEGWFSWQHLLYATLMVALTVALGIILGRKNRNKSFEEKLKPLKVAAWLLLGFELFKIVLICCRHGSIERVRSMLPLFLCSIMLFAGPLAAWAKGKLKEAALDFSFIFGMLCCITGSYLSGNYFSNSPVLSFDPMCSVTTHCISGFFTVYIGVAGLVGMKRKNIWIMYVILLVFEAMAYAVNRLQHETSFEHNYMFLDNPAGTPFSICLDIVGGNQTLYTVFVALLYFIYLGVFIGIYLLCTRKKRARAAENI